MQDKSCYMRDSLCIPKPWPIKQGRACQRQPGLSSFLPPPTVNVCCGIRTHELRIIQCYEPELGRRLFCLSFCNPLVPETRIRLVADVIHLPRPKMPLIIKQSIFRTSMEKEGGCSARSRGKGDNFFVDVTYLLHDFSTTNFSLSVYKETRLLHPPKQRRYRAPCLKLRQ
jgi:hypothetical protein